jgi:heme A synthase
MKITTGEKIMTVTASLIFIVIATGIIIVFHSIDLLWNPFSILIILLISLFAILPFIRLYIFKKKSE